MDFPGSSDGKVSAYNVGDPGSMEDIMEVMRNHRILGIFWR